MGGDDLLLHVGQNLRFAPTQRRLVAELEEVAHRVGTLAVEPADRQAHVGGGALHLLEFPHESQPRQMQHHAHPQAGADVGGAGGEVAEARREGVIDAGLDAIVHLVDLTPCRPEREAGADDLDAEVVLLVDHDAQAFVGEGDGDAAGVLAAAVDERAALAELLGDEVTLDEHHPLEGRGVVDVAPDEAVGQSGAKHAVATGLERQQAIATGRSRAEGMAREVAGQPHAGGHDHVGAVSLGAEPFGHGVEERAIAGRRGLAHAASSPWPWESD